VRLPASEELGSLEPAKGPPDLEADGRGCCNYGREPLALGAESADRMHRLRDGREFFPAARPF